MIDVYGTLQLQGQSIAICATCLVDGEIIA